MVLSPVVRLRRRALSTCRARAVPILAPKGLPRSSELADWRHREPSTVHGDLRGRRGRVVAAVHSSGNGAAHEDLGHRLRLPRRRARGVDGRTRPRGRRHRRRRAARSTRSPRPRRRSTSPASRSCSSARSPPGGSVQHRLRRRGRARRCTSSASGTPQKRSEYAADLRYVEGATESLIGVLAPGDLVVGKSTVPVGHRGPAGRAGRGQGARARCWPGTRSSCARASPSRTPCTPTGSSTASRGGADGDTARALLDEVYAPIVAARHAAGRSPTTPRRRW